MIDVIYGNIASYLSGSNDTIERYIKEGVCLSMEGLDPTELEQLKIKGLIVTSDNLHIGLTQLGYTIATTPQPNWEGFILALRASSAIKNWFGAINALDQNYLTIQISTRNIQAIETFMGAIDYSAIKTELETLIGQFNIPLTL